MLRSLPSLVGGGVAFSPSDISGLKLWAAYLLTEPSARDFETTNTEYFSVASPATDYDLGTGDFGISVAVNRETTGALQYICGKYVDGNNYWSLSIDASNNVQFDAVVSGVAVVALSGTTALSSTTDWYVITVIVDRSSTANTKVYVDGADDTSGTPTVSATDVTLTAAFEVGRQNAGNYWDGLMSQFGWFAPADISTQAASIVSTTYNGGAGTQHGKLTTAFKTDSGLTNWHDLNEYDGNAVDAEGSSDWTDNNTVTSAIGPGTDKIADESGNINHGTITGYTNTGDIVSTDVPSALAGSLDYSMKFDGAEYLDCGDSDEFSFTDGFQNDSAFSVSTFIKQTSTSGIQGICSKRTDGTGFEFDIESLPNTGRWYVVLWKEGSTSARLLILTDNAITANTWVHFAMTYDGSGTAAGIKVYFDAVLQNTTDGSTGSYTGMNNTSVPLRWGIVNADPNVALIGYLADNRLYNKELTANEVTYLHTAGASGTDPTTANLVGQWGGSNDSFPFGAVVDGQPVIRIDDRSDSAADGTSTTLSKRPIYDSANSALTFDAVDDLMDLVSSVALTDCTIFVKTILASDVTSATSQKTLLGTQSAGAASNGAALITLGATSAGLTNETASMLAQDNTTTRGAGYATTISSGTRVLTFRLEGTTEAIYLDGTSVSVAEDSGGSLDSATAGQRFDRVSRLGSDSTPGNYLGDKVVEVLIYDSALSTDDIDSVHTYLGL
jgi:hypothetical protein